MPASNEYISVSDITAKSLLQMPLTTQEAYVERVNLWYEAYAEAKNVDIEDIQFPVSITITEFLQSKMLMLFSTDNINGSSTNMQTAGIYQNIYIMAKEQYNNAATRINSGVIRGYENSETRGVVFGTRVR